MSRLSTFPLHDRALDGQLKPILKRFRRQGVSYNDIAFRLRDEHQIVVTATTVMRWCNENGITTEAKS